MNLHHRSDLSRKTKIKKIYYFPPFLPLFFDGDAFEPDAFSFEFDGFCTDSYETVDLVGWSAVDSKSPPTLFDPYSNEKKVIQSEFFLTKLIW